MDVLLALILSCSVHYDDHLVEALAMKLSIGNQYFVGDLATLDTYDTAHSIAEARKVIDSVAAKGGRAAVGYMAVPIAWAPRFGRTTDELFDGCTNIGIATAMLSQYEYACTMPRARRSHLDRRRRRQARGSVTAIRYCILRHLEADLEITGIVEHVIPDVAKLDAQRSVQNDDPPPARAAIFPDNTDSARLDERGDWSNPRLLSPFPPARSERPPGAPLPRTPDAAPTSARRSAPHSTLPHSPP
ncbi:MAG TPA: hypothetical protein VHO06_27000 [Polyangia bacterium]|nr:hypothetical protein [Polyangia bacterium]